jgi:hypothetical protein
MKKSILKIGSILTKPEQLAINGGFNVFGSCTVDCPVGDDISCDGDSAHCAAYYCTYKEDGRIKHTFCNNLQIL